MALIKCYECGAKISTEAIGCPHCGAPKKEQMVAVKPEKNKTSPLAWTVLVLIVLFVLMVIATPKQGINSSHSPQAKKELERQLVEQVQTVPASEVEENIRIYEQLHDLDPDNARYQTKLAHYRSQRDVNDAPTAWNLIPTPGKAKSVVVEDFAMSHEDYEKIIQQLCSPNEFCWVDFWSDERLVPRDGGLDISDRQCEAWVANYVRNPSTGFEGFNWDPC